MLDLGAIFAVNFLLAVLSLPFLWKLVPRNRLYGFRVPATLRSDEVWYAMNRVVAREVIPVGFLLAFLAAAFDRLGLNTPVGRGLLTIATLIAIATIMARGWIAANRMERQARTT